MTTLIDNTEDFGTRVYVPDSRFTAEPAHDRLQDTFVGMAHIAGTGPEGSICCECTRWGDDQGKDPKRYSFRAGTLRPGELHPGYCHRFVHGKRFQKFPGNAKACMFFEERKEPPAYRLDPPKDDESDG